MTVSFPLVVFASSRSQPQFVEGNPAAQFTMTKGSVLHSTDGDVHLNRSPSIVVHTSKSTQTRWDRQERDGSVYPFYCLSVKDGQLVPLFVSPSRSAASVQRLMPPSSSSPSSIDDRTSEYHGQHLNDGEMVEIDSLLSVPLIFRSYFSTSSRWSPPFIVST